MIEIGLACARFDVFALERELAAFGVDVGFDAVVAAFGESQARVRLAVFGDEHPRLKMGRDLAAGLQDRRDDSLAGVAAADVA